MNLAPYIPLAGAILNFFFALFVYSRAPRRTANQIYLFIGLCIAVWNLGSYFLFVVETKHEALFWARFLHMGIILGVVAYFHLSFLIAGYSVGRWIGWIYAFQLGLAITNLTPLFIADIRHLGTAGWYAVAGPTYYVFSLPFNLMFCSTFVLLRRRRSLPRMQRRRLTPLIVAQFCLTAFGANDILPIIRIDKYPFTDIYVYPWGSLAAVFYGIIAAYAVLQYQLLDIQVGLSRFAATFIRFAFLFSIALALLIAVEAVTQSFNDRSFVLALLVFVVSSITASWLFPRLFGGKGLEKWERRILGDRFEYQDRVRSFIENITWHSDLNELLNDLHHCLVRSFRFQRYSLVLRDASNRTFTVWRAFPDGPQGQIPNLNVNSPVFRFFEWGKQEFLPLYEDAFLSTHPVLAREAREQLTEFRAEFAFPLTAEDELFGLLLVGKKESEEPLTATDINLLILMVKTLSLMVNQIQMRTQIMQSQEMDLLGRMSRGMAHDLNNLLTPVWTMLQLASEGMRTEAFDDELVNVALRNIKTIRAYIKEALFFSENLRPDFQLGRLDMLVNNVVEIAKTSRRKNVDVIAVTKGEALMEMDEVLIQRCLQNLVSNAIDASPEGAQVRVELEPLVTADHHREWFRIRVVDSGEGIPKENLHRVMTPYFTTKNRGDENRGFGLGLAICRKIVTLHGGNLSLASLVKKGTTIQVDLPNRQMKLAAPVAVASEASTPV